MARDWFEAYGDPENRKDAVRRNLARVGLSLDNKATLAGDVEPEGVKARKDHEAAQRLAKRDAMWGVFPGCTLGTKREDENGKAI